jgi:ribosomal protein S18 acetylase RimI-like enzyme
VQIRPVRPEEYQTAGQVVLSAYEALPGSHMTEEYAALLADVARRSVEAEVLAAVGQSAEGRTAAAQGLLGCVTFVPDASSPWAEMLAEDESGARMLAVSPAAQGRGIGRALLGACIGRARELGRSGLLLHSTPWMPAAHHLYEKAGFTRVPERDWRPIPEVPLLAFRLDVARLGGSSGG